MKKLAGIAVAGLFAMFFPSPAMSQLAPGYSGHAGVREARLDEYFWSVKALGTCLYRTKPTWSLKLLEAARGSDEEGGAKRELIGRQTKCLQEMKSMTVSDMALRGTIAEAVYRKAGYPVLPAQTYDVLPKVTQEAANEMGVEGLTSALGDCILARYPEQVAAYLKADLGSGVAGRHLELLAGKMAECSPGGVKFQLDRMEFRGTLSEAVYRRLKARDPVNLGAAG